MRQSGITLEHYGNAWWIDAGTVHGIEPPQGDEATLLAVLPRRDPDTPLPGGKRPLGPHFEEICRQWTRWHAGPETYDGAYPVRVASGTVSDPEARKTAEVDVCRLRPW